ncbi:MAG TPA: hypothetical protein VF762_18645 [Blastocatellia bacterium]|jgi:hypothetical protein
MPSKVIDTFAKKVPLEAVRADLAVLVGVMIAAGFIVKQGDVIGKISASGKYRRRTHSVTAGAGFADDSTVGHVSDASVFAAGDVLKKADGTLIGTVAVGGVNAVNNTLTLTANAALDVAAGVDVVASDGSQVAEGISDLETDGTQDANVPALIGGYLNESLLRGLDSTAKAELGGASVAGGIFKF